VTLFNSARVALREVRAAVTPENPAYPMTSTTLVDWLGGPKVHAGVAVNETSALGMTAVYRAVALISGSSASLPLHAYRESDGGRVRLSTGQAANLLDYPHPDMTPFEFWELVYVHLLTWGNAYIRVLRNRNGQIAELWALHPSRVRAGRESDEGLKVYQIDGAQEPLFDDKILHIPGMGYDGVTGCSPIRLARQGVGLALAAEEYGARLFGSGSLMAGILQTEQRLTAEQADALKRRWKEKVSGIERAHDVAILDAGAKWQAVSIPPGDAQFIESRRFQVAEVARMYGVPPHMLMESEKSTTWGSGIESMSAGFVRYTLRPWLTRVEQRVTKLLRPQAVYARYSIEGLLRGSAAERAAFYTAMWNIGVYNTDDIRALEELAPVPGGDTRYRPLNMGELGQPDPKSEQESVDAG
jgi:HK97 family phage portal protein